MTSSPLTYVEHILIEIEFLESLLTQFSYGTFRANPMAYRSAIYSIQCISEAVRHLPTAWLDRHPDIRWNDIRGIGNHTRHEYSNLLPFLIWDIMLESISPLKAAVLSIQTENSK